MYERSTIKLPFPATSTITTEMAREIIDLEDFEISYSTKDISWTRLAIENLDYMIALAISAGCDYSALDIQRTQLQSILRKNNA